MKKTIELTSENFNAHLAKSTGPVLVDFWAQWCGPCRMLAPVLDELAAEYDGRVDIAKVDVDASPELASQYGVRALPTLLVLKDGKVVDQLLGAQSKGRLRAFLDKATGALVAA